MNSPSITDWIQAIGIFLTIPSLVWGIFNLFRKDIDKQNQLNALSEISGSQNKMLLEMQKQVIELQKQSECLLDSNELLKEQIKIQNEALTNDKDYKDRYIQLERMKRVSSIKPHFKASGNGFSDSTLRASFINIGKRAYDFKVIKIEANNLSVFGTREPKIVETDQKIEINGERSAKVNGEWPKYNATMKMEYYDEDKNRYEQEILIGKDIGTGSNVKIGQPILKDSMLK
jgi:hypothetical protein